ncbi:single-stranded DNA-binding protein [Peribacillus asahii]|uniref:single-stranded DNA-binding protein n=1 Tax=Peribacillus asahii TaxID=228899 RepID=UPI00207A7BB4|nr:single-stranded DNA-binding protein [Peribacillus asahii]USK62259.1 single-stranded DNA-binding protein [Peribacillus asahii]
MQNLMFVGRLTKEPNLTYSNGIAKCTFPVAVESRVGSQKRIDYLPVVLWRQAAENAAQYLVKGQRVGINGRIKTGSYEINGGPKVPSFEVEALDVQYYDAPKRN